MSDTIRPSRAGKARSLSYSDFRVKRIGNVDAPCFCHCFTVLVQTISISTVFVRHISPFQSIESLSALVTTVPHGLSTAASIILVLLTRFFSLLGKSFQY